MMSCSVNAGITARSGIRQRLSSTYFAAYRSSLIESDNIYSFVMTPPSLSVNFLGRHIYRYSRSSETFGFIGHQKGQAIEVNKWAGNGFVINNTNLSNLNNNKFYYNIDPDPSRPQWNIYDDQTILKQLFNHRNLYDDQVVFIDTKWCGFEDNRRKDDGSWYANTIGSINMNQEKGKIYRIGTISKENINYINEMLFTADYIGADFNPPKGNYYA